MSIQDEDEENDMNVSLTDDLIGKFQSFKFKNAQKKN